MILNGLAAKPPCSCNCRGMPGSHFDIWRRRFARCGVIFPRGKIVLPCHGTILPDGEMTLPCHETVFPYCRAISSHDETVSQLAKRFLHRTKTRLHISIIFCDTTEVFPHLTEPLSDMKTRLGHITEPFGYMVKTLRDLKFFAGTVKFLPGVAKSWSVRLAGRCPEIIPFRGVQNESGLCVFSVLLLRRAKRASPFANLFVSAQFPAHTCPTCLPGLMQPLQKLSSLWRIFGPTRKLPDNLYQCPD